MYPSHSLAVAPVAGTEVVTEVVTVSVSSVESCMTWSGSDHLYAMTALAKGP